MIKNSYATFYKILFLLTIFCSSIVYAENHKIILKDTIGTEDKLKLRDYKRGGEFYPQFPLSENDPIEWPIIYELNVEILKISNFSMGNEVFRAEKIFTTYRNVSNPYQWELKKEQGLSEDDYMIEWNHSDDIQYNLDVALSEGNFIGDPIKEELRSSRYTNRTYDNSSLFYDDMVSRETRLLDYKFPMDWDYSKYPFDKQKMTFELRANVDSSVVKLVPSKIPSVFKDTFFLKKTGYNVKFDFSDRFRNIDSELVNVSRGVTRKTVLQTLVVDLILERSFLNQLVIFFKLFIVGIISYLIASLAFLFEVKELESRINLVVGGIFGVMGNKYYSDSIMPVNSVNITTIDWVNILLLTMLLFNVLILLIQHKSIFKNSFQNNSIVYNGKIAFFFSIMVFVFSLTILLYLL